MKRLAGFGMLLLAGCSTAPVADLLDWVKPGRISSEKTAPYGGVCQPHPGGPVLGPGVPGGPPAPPPAPIGAPPPPASIGAPPPPIPALPAPAGSVAPPPPIPARAATTETDIPLITPVAAPSDPN